MTDAKVELTISKTSGHKQPDADLVSIVEDVDLSDIGQRHIDDWVVCDDSTTNPSYGVIVRTITLDLTPQFLVRYPTDSKKGHQIQNIYKSALQVRIPYVGVEESFSFGLFC